ncbi:MAG: ParA family protein [Firmicutes bacterium]|nr:ParA family protein [Bacillota bacterium]
MGICLAIVNQKGGVGKSTTAVNLGACLAEAGKRVLLVDIDPQGNATSGVGVEKRQLDGCMYDVLIEGRDIEEVILPTEVSGLEVAPATLELAGAEIELVSAMSREYRLKGSLDGVKDNYDYILIDAPPSLGLLTINALSAANAALVPIQCEYYALEGVSQLVSTVSLVKEHLNPNLEIAGVLMTMYDARTNLSQQVVEEVKRFFGEKVFQTIIPRNVRLSEAPSHGQPIILYDPQCRGAQAYRDLAREVMGA